MEPRTSGLKMFSIGIVVEDKPEGTDLIKVSPVEELTLMNGPLSGQKTNYKSDLPDHKGVKRQEAVEGGSILVAKWIPFENSNRMNAPDVYASETVMIFRMADTDEYYWCTIMREPGIRRLETVNLSCSNIPKGLKAFDKDSSYWLEISTRNKHVQLHMSNNDGEPFVWDLIFDTTSGTFSVNDDVGNAISMDSKNDIIKVNSVAGANITMDKGHIKMHGITITATADEKITLQAPEIVMSEKLTMTGDSTFNGDVDVNGMSNLNEGVQGKGGVDLSGGDFNVSGGNTRIDGGSITLTGGSITANGEDLTTDLT